MAKILFANGVSSNLSDDRGCGGTEMSKVGWGAVVLGEPVDLEDWVLVLKEPFDPWVEVYGSETVLRSASLDELDSASEVRDRSIAQIERLNGAMAVSQGTKPLRFGGVIQFTAEGHQHRTMFAEAVLEGRSTCHRQCYRPRRKACSSAASTTDGGAAVAGNCRQR